MKTYEDLTGATGRRIFYRAERFNARDLFTRMPPRVLIEGAPYSLVNLSMSGLAVSVGLSNATPHEIGSEVEIVLENDTGALFSGTGNLCRIEDRSPDSTLAISFKGTSLDIPALVNRHNEALIQRELNGGLSHALDLVPQDYRRFCADVLHLLRAYRSTLSRFENVSNRDGETADSERVLALYAAAEERLLPEWRRLWHEGNALTRPMMDSLDVLHAVKKFTEQLLTPELMGGPIWNRSYRKPLGYPGDFQMMNYVYEWLPRGATVYERLLHRIGLDVAECIATRMVMIQKEIARMVSAGSDSDNPARVLSLGCGSAQEVFNYLELKKLPRPLSITLVDQDHTALDYSYSRIFPQTTRHGNGTSVQCLQVSFIELMKAGKIFQSLPPQDLIYTVGLVDYLSIKRIQRLVGALYEKLTPGGKLVVGNMADVPGSNMWPMEFLCDWSLNYRNEEQMLQMAQAIPDTGVQLELSPDSTGRIYILSITKPGGCV
jgi:hypothetical protein